MYIYIHIPFCNHICSYCDFPKVLYDKKYINKYLDSLKREIVNRYKGEVIKTIYIGGGTPTALDYDELEKLLDITDIFNKDNNIEFTIESNIESIDDDKIRLLKRYNVNRVSLGVQSFDKDILRDLGRIHSKDDVIRVVDLLKKNDINNISIDLIYGVNDDINVIKRDINLFLSLNIPHVSCYSLIIEEHTLYGINNREYIDDDIDYNIYKYIEDTLIDKGYKHYEVSNYARDGYESIHNINYWNNGEYYGFGLGAVSYINKYRIVNTKSLTKYIDGYYLDNKIYEDINEEISNTLILGLRKIDGIEIDKFNSKYQTNIIDLYNIKELIRDKKLIINNNRLFVNSKYFYLLNDILVNFI